MSPEMRMWVEIGFNIAYLTVITILIVKMWRRRNMLAPQDARLGKLILLAFIFLALGDYCHVGFRVLAYANGDLSASNPTNNGSSLVGIGALATAVTVTFFYVVMLFAWQERYKRKLTLLPILLLVAAGARLVLMAMPQNDWSATVPPQPWSLYRNLPLMIQGLGLAYLILRDSIAQKDKMFQWIGICILLSYAFYIPVILFVQVAPPIGMLMIPKTIAYVAIAFIAYRGLFQPAEERQKAASVAITG